MEQSLSAPESLEPAPADLHLSSRVPPTVDDPNPWSDDPTSSLSTALPPPDPAITISEPTHAMPSFSDIAAGREKRSSVPVDRDVLDAFDPLAESPEEQAAHDAWASSEGHPPPPAQLAQLDPEPSAGSSNVESSAAHPKPQPAPFPALTAFARSFALPSLPIARRPARSERPMSMDHATLIQTPVMGDSFLEQQERPTDQMQRRGSPKLKEAKEEFQIKRKGKSRSVDLWPASAGSGSASPVREGAVFDEKEARREEGKRVPSPAPPPPFDFQKFLDQMKGKGSEPVARYLRSFLSNFSKRTFTVTDQMKLINDFLGFISQKMRAAEPWRNATDAEFDNAMEGMEKLVMNRLYDYTFTPATSRLVPPRPITTDDLERDRVLSQRIALFGWIEPRHLDVPVEDEHAVGGFLMFAQQELVKVNHYKAPRDKLICILNCCKVIFGLIRHLAKDESADTFLPILIFIVLKANPEHLLSNVEFINRFRNPTKLQSEAGYYLSSLMGAVSFIETMDHTSLSQITQEEFEKNVERAIQSLPSSRPPTPSHTSTSTSATTSASPSPSPSPTPRTSGHAPSSSTSSNIHRPPAQPIPVPPPQPIPSMTSPHAGEEPAQPLSLNDFDARRLLQRTGDTISKPLNAIGRIFSEALDGAEERFIQAQAQLAAQTQTPARESTALSEGFQTPTPYRPRVRRGHSPGDSNTSTGSFQFPAPDETPTKASSLGIPPATLGPAQPQSPRLAAFSQSNPASGYPSRTATPSMDFDIPGLQAEIDRAHERQAEAARGTLAQIFPGVDKEILELVLEAEEGDLGKSIEKLLEMSSGV